MSMFGKFHVNLPRQPADFWIKALASLTLILLLGSYFEHRFMIGIDTQKVSCLPGNHRWFLIDRYDQMIDRGDIMAFKADQRVLPWYPIGQIMVKYVAGVAGDWIEVTDQAVLVNGVIVAEGGLILAQKLNKPATAFIRQEQIPQHALWATGTMPRSFDSRYWGFVFDEQVIGKVYAIPFL